MYTKPGGCVDLTSPRWHLVPAEACPHVRVCVAFKGYFVGVNYSYLSRSTFLGKCVFTFSRDLLMPELNLHIDQINISSVLRGGPVLDTLDPFQASVVATCSALQLLHHALLHSRPAVASLLLFMTFSHKSHRNSFPGLPRLSLAFLFFGFSNSTSICC